LGIKILTLLFALIAVRRVIVRYRKRGALTVEFALWMFVFSGIGIVSFIPGETDRFARWLGVSSGFNLLSFVAIAGLLLATFRLIARVHGIDRDLTRLVRMHALINAQKVAARADEPSEPASSATVK
jgi:hypothetical protein